MNRTPFEYALIDARDKLARKDWSEKYREHRWREVGGGGGHRGEYDWKCTVCGASDWLSRDAEPPHGWHGECLGTKQADNTPSSSDTD